MKRKRRMRRRLALVSAGLGVVLGGKVRRFYRELDLVTGEDDRFFAETDDGWRIAIHHYAPDGPAKSVAVIAGHGFAGTRLIWDLTPETSLARFLAGHGYHFYAVDLRGRGESWPVEGHRSQAQWSFDDFVFHDVPAVVDAACRHAGADTAFWLGLEMSGQLLYASAISQTAPRLRGGVTFGSPVLTPPDAKVPGVTTQPRARRHGRVQFRAGAHYAGPILALMRSKQLASSFRPENFDPVGPARYFRHGVPDEAVTLADQFSDWIDHATMRTCDHTTTWSERLDEFTLPVLVMTAALDLQRPAAATRATFESLGSADKEFFEAGLASGLSVDYGHDDLVAGRASPTEIFPRVLAWLDARTMPAGG